MGGGITIILIAAIGAGYFLYQKFRSRNRGGNMTQGSAKLTSLFNRIMGNRSRNANVGGRQGTFGSQQATQMPTPPTATSPERNRPLVPASRDGITETGPMVYFANDRHGRSDREYRFNYKKVGGGWRAYILRMPNLGNRDSGSGVIHRLHDNSGYYICWDRQVNTLKDMQNISRRWADSIQEYISTGRFG